MLRSFLYLNHEASLFKLKQTTTMEVFLHDIECLSTRVTRLHPLNLMNYFLSSLKEEIQRELYMMKPQNLHDAVGLAKLMEDKIRATPVVATRPLFQRPPLAVLPPAAALPPTSSASKSLSN